MPAADLNTSGNFRIYDSKDSKGKKARCIHCNGYDAVHRVDRERRHLNTCKEYKAAMAEQIPTKMQSLMGKYLTGHVSFSPEKKQQLDALFAQAIFYGGLAFSTFENPFFQMAFDAIGYRPPSRDLLRRKWLPTVYEALKEDVQTQHWSKAQYLAFTADESKSIANERIANLSVLTPHGVSFYGVSLDTGSVRHTAEELYNVYAPAMLEVAGGEGQEGRINAFVTDSCATMRKLWKLVQAKYPHCFCVPDDAHGKQLLIKDLLLSTEIKPTFDKAARIVNYFNNAPLQLALLRDVQRKVLGKEFAFQQHGLTRWGTTVSNPCCNTVTSTINYKLDWPSENPLDHTTRINRVRFRGR